MTQIGIIAIGGKPVGIVSLCYGNEADPDPFIPDLDGYSPEGRASEIPQGMGYEAATAHRHPSHPGASLDDMARRGREHAGASLEDRARHGRDHVGASLQDRITHGAHHLPGKARISRGTSDVNEAIEQAAKAHNLSPAFMKSVASIESGMNPSSNANKATQYKGLFQVGHDEWKRFGNGGNPYNAADNAMAAARMFDANRAAFKKQFGRDPTDTEMYLMHQQGLGFYTRGTMTNIAGNLPAGARTPANMTHAGFERYWGNQIADREAKFSQAAKTSDNANPAPSSILARAKEVAKAGGSGAVQRFMAANGYPKDGNWCFSGDTEILSERGFVRLDELEDGAVVYQADECGKLSLVKSVKIEKDYAGDVFDIKHRSLRLTCDVGHRWFGYWDRSSTPEFRTLSDLRTDGLSIPGVHAGYDDMNVADDQLRFIAAFMSDGSFHGDSLIYFEVSKPRKIEALAGLDPYSSRINKRTYGISKTPLTVIGFTLPNYFRQIFSGYKQLRDDFINALSARQAEVFLDAYATFDGNANKTFRILYSSNVSIRDALIRIALAAGYYPTIGKKFGSFTGRPCWEVRMSRRGKRRFITPRHISRRAFAGKLYCVTVPHGRIIVRGQDSSPVMTGNCGEFAAAVVKSTGGSPPRNAQVASNWRNWGRPTTAPKAGDVAIRRGARTGDTGSHVTFVDSYDPATGTFKGIGGNQGAWEENLPVGRYEFRTDQD